MRKCVKIFKDFYNIYIFDNGENYNLVIIYEITIPIQ